MPGHERSTTKKPFPLRQWNRDPETKHPHEVIQAGQLWTQGICPNCGEAEAEVDPDGILWCCACGYSKKGCYT